MQFFSAAAVLVTVTGGWASNVRNIPESVVTVCLEHAEGPTFYVARETANGILKEAGVRLQWQAEDRFCAAAANGIVITVLPETPADMRPGALAYAMPYGRGGVVLFYDRVIHTVRSDRAPVLLGYVLAHEIVHVLQGIERHSDMGIMKARWSGFDYDDMRRGRLQLTTADISLIHGGLHSHSRVAPAE
jgi:hypothetical protein